MIGWILWFACERPVPLPEPSYVAIDARAVRFEAVSGYLARPRAGEGPAALLLVDALDAQARAAAEERARAGAWALATAPDVPVAAARAYLEGMAGARGPATVVCLRATPCGDG